MKTGTCFCSIAARTAAPVFLVLLASVSLALNSSAQPITLNPFDNSTVQVNPTGGNLVQNWDINGNNILNSALNGFQNLYWQAGGGVATPIQTGIGVLSSPNYNQNGDTATLNTTYGNASSP